MSFPSSSCLLQAEEKETRTASITHIVASFMPLHYRIGGEYSSFSG
jgi:hypothetical protein